MPRKVIIITDPGQDQAVAILMALAAPESFNILGIVTSAGNIDLNKTQRNARALVELAGRTDVPVFAGCPRPIGRPLVTAEHVHGPTGLDGADLPEPTVALRAQHGVDFIVETLRAQPAGEVSIFSESPLTNLAMALVKAPDIAERIGQIVMMAGAYFEVGNITPSAEFNIYVDPQAADIVLKAGIPTVMLPLDVTHKLLSTPERLRCFAGLGNRGGKVVANMLGFSESFDLRKYGWMGAPLHGPTVPAFMIEPGMFKGRQVNVSVEICGELTLGMTVVDYWEVTDRPKNVLYVTDGDADAYFKLIAKLIGRLP
ncbi:nucleoside hydrolase [Phyllobacterium chamaecytisi]|uniref:nucleoside hydrolase n=1 Tax=Phyllobacterium chamaecytisi TaxID=2876082 RepID=UPI001CCF8938|nr:nucleoside hydrolase [Phyllobacterium sp. KW56]MBZ9603303.1 nucleoside hydrolase [Phyllobacterium sp. KW56]